METNKSNSFEVLNNVNVSSKLKAKIGLKYLSWADAWNILKSYYPDAFYTVYTRTVETVEESNIEDNNYGTKKVIRSTFTNEVPYFSDGRTCFVKVGVTIEGVEYIELLPVMDNKNNAVPVASITMTAVNKAIQRAFVKACARHGLGLYVYAGEDLPDIDKKEPVVIDFKGIRNEVESINYSNVGSDQFEALRNSVIGKVQAAEYPQEVMDAIIAYVTEVLGGKRLSLLTVNEDNIQLQKVNNFIAAIEKING